MNKPKTKRCGWTNKASAANGRKGGRPKAELSVDDRLLSDKIAEALSALKAIKANAGLLRRVQGDIDAMTTKRMAESEKRFDAIKTAKDVDK